MKLSIIVPVYNMMEHGKLEYCLNSLVNQTVSDYELILVDDGSTDNSLSLCKEYREKYPELIKIIELPVNIKQGGAKNRGLDIAQGDYLGFIDSDDWIMPDMYEKLIAAAEREDADIAACHLCLTREHSFEVKDSVQDITADMTGEITPDKFKKLMTSFGALVTKVYKRHIFYKPLLRFPEKMFYEDNAVSLEIISRAKRLVLVDETMYFYLQSNNSTVHTVSEERCRDRMEAMRIMLKYSIDGNYYESFKKEIEYQFIHLFYQNTLFSYVSTVKPCKLSLLRSMARELRETFPNFTDNEYYQGIDAEERREMELLQKSALIFIVYYRLLWFYRRNLRK